MWRGQCKWQHMIGAGSMYWGSRGIPSIQFDDNLPLKPKHDVVLLPIRTNRKWFCNGGRRGNHNKEALKFLTWCRISNTKGPGVHPFERDHFVLLKSTSQKKLYL